LLLLVYEIFNKRSNQIFQAAHFAKRNTKFGGGKRGRAKIPSPPTPFLFARPGRAFGLAREARRQFRSK